MADLVVVKAKIKDHAKGMNVSADFAEALSQRVSTLIRDAAARAKANKRQTVKARDV